MKVMKKRPMKKRIALVALVALIAACGSRTALKRPPGDNVPPVPAAAETPPTSDDLVTPDAQARPERNDEILKRSERREDDRFDLPPTG